MLWGLVTSATLLATLKWLLFGLGSLLLLYIVLLYMLQEKFVYVPEIPGLSRAYDLKPSRYGLPYENVPLVAKDGTNVHGWLIRPQGIPHNPGPTVLFLQENAGSIAHRLPNVLFFIKNVKCNVFILSYRGYGESEGKPSESGIKQDAQAALDHLLQRKDIDTSKLVVFGRSLGGAVASWLAAENPTAFRTVLLENTFLSIPALAPCLLPLIGSVIGHGNKPLNWIIKSSWKGEEFVARILSPVLFLSGGADEMVPQWHMRGLHQAATSPKSEWKEFPTGRHMDMYQVHQEEYWQTVNAFLQKHGCFVWN